MAIIFKQTLDEHTEWALWELSEDEPTLLHLCQPDTEMLVTLAGIAHETKRREFLASRALLRQLLAEQNQYFTGIYKDENGKPHLRGTPYQFSLSHSAEFVAVAISKKQAIGIDIEPIKPKILRIAPRFLSVLECVQASTSQEKATLYWCVKEAMYKLFNQNKCSLREHLRVSAFDGEYQTQVNGFIQMPDYKAHAQVFSHVHLQYCIAIAQHISGE
jgi:4'-phosphopantetheinyl transferase